MEEIWLALQKLLLWWKSSGQNPAECHIRKGRETHWLTSNWWTPTRMLCFTVSNWPYPQNRLEFPHTTAIDHAVIAPFFSVYQFLLLFKTQFKCKFFGSYSSYWSLPSPSIGGLQNPCSDHGLPRVKNGTLIQIHPSHLTLSSITPNSPCRLVINPTLIQ